MRTRWRWTIAILAVATTGFVCLLAVVHHDQRAGLGDEIGYDDFAFGVDDVHWLSPSGIAAGERDLVVRFVVWNHARRVDFDTSHHEPRVEDASGKEYASDRALTEASRQRAGTPTLPAVLQAGESFACDYVFRVPAEARGLRLRVHWPAAVDWLDRVVFGDRSFELEPR